MLASALIVFREVLEAALIVSVVFVASEGVAKRGRWISGGMIAGILGAAIVAAFAGAIAEAAEGMGQEIFNAGVLFVAVGFLGWHNVWMHKHGREIAHRMKAVGLSIAAGRTPLVMLSVVVGLAVLREGSEVALFLYGISVGGGVETSGLMAGSALGLAGGVMLGFAMYFGLVHIPTRHLFSVISWLILLLAAGMAAQGAGYLVQADVLPEFGGTLWDTSGILAEASIPGQLLHTLIGYEDRPLGIQLLFYVLTALIIWILMRVGHPSPTLKSGFGALARRDSSPENPVASALETNLK